MTEMYSAIEAEVPIPADPRTLTNVEFVEDLKRAKKVIIGGQALSHCVNYTTRDLLRYWAPRDPADLIVLLDGKAARKVHQQYLERTGLTMSPVAFLQAARLCLDATPAPVFSSMTCVQQT
jgi:nicotinamidase-related amidase